MCTYDLKYNDYYTNVSDGLRSMLVTADIADVTLAVEGELFKTHQVVLSIFSPYFRELFSSNPCKHPIFFMKDVKCQVMKDLLTFMYEGKVQIAEEEFYDFVETAKALKVKGLTNMAEPTTLSELASNSASKSLGKQLNEHIGNKEHVNMTHSSDNRPSLKRPHDLPASSINEDEAVSPYVKKNRTITQALPTLSEVSVLPLPVPSTSRTVDSPEHAPPNITISEEPVNLLEIPTKDQQSNIRNNDEQNQAASSTIGDNSDEVRYCQDTIELDSDDDNCYIKTEDYATINLQEDDDDLLDPTGDMPPDQMIGQEGEPVSITLCRSYITQKICAIIWDDFRYMHRKTYKSWSSWLCGNATSRKCKARLILTFDRRMVVIDSHTHDKGRIKRIDCTNVQRTYYTMSYASWKISKGHYPSNRTKSLPLTH